LFFKWPFKIRTALNDYVLPKKLEEARLIDLNLKKKEVSDNFKSKMKWTLKGMEIEHQKEELLKQEEIERHRKIEIEKEALIQSQKQISLNEKRANAIRALEKRLN